MERGLFRGKGWVFRGLEVWEGRERVGEERRGEGGEGEVRVGEGRSIVGSLFESFCSSSSYLVERRRVIARI